MMNKNPFKKISNKKHPLAYNRVLSKVKLPEEYHKGKKIMDKDREKIRQLYKTTNHSYRTLAELYQVSYGTIQVIINPNTYNQSLANAKKWRNKQKALGIKRAKQTMDIRYRKRELVEKGIITIKP